MLPRCVLIERPTEYDELLARHGTREAVRFFLTQRGLSLEVIEARHRTAAGVPRRRTRRDPLRLAAGEHPA